MHTILHYLPIAMLGLEPWMVAIVVPVAGLIFAGVLIVSGMYFQHRRREMWHQTARIALEKGQPLPPSYEPVGLSEDVKERMAEAAVAASNPGPRWRGYLIGGLINVGVGGGLFMALSQIPNTNFNVGYFGLIPLFIGVALLIGAVVEGMLTRK